MTDVAGRLKALGPGGVRLAQLAALRVDLFRPVDVTALTRDARFEAVAPPEAGAIVAAECGRTIAGILPHATPVPVGGNPMLWATRGFGHDGRERMMTIALPSRAPDTRAIAAAVAVLTPMIARRDRSRAARSLAHDLTRWVAADLDLAAQARALARWRRIGLHRDGIVVVRVDRSASAAHVLTLAAPTAAPVAGSDDPDAAGTLVAAALEQAFVHHAVPVSPDLSHLATLPGARIVRTGIGAIEPLSPMLVATLPALSRAAVAEDPGVAAAVVAGLLREGPRADRDRLMRGLVEAQQGSPASRFRRMLGAAGSAGFDVPADLLALGRWLVATIETALAIDPALPLADCIARFALRRDIERLVRIPDGATAARALLGAIAPVEALPGRLDRLIAAATDPDHRVPVDLREAPTDTRRRLAEARLVAVAIGWTGAALMLVAVRGVPVVSALLWVVAAACAVGFVVQWHRTGSGR